MRMMKPLEGYVIVSGNGDASRVVCGTEIDAWIDVIGNDARKIFEAQKAGHRAVFVRVEEATPPYSSSRT